jgi:prepilin peptidase CpaA
MYVTILIVAMGVFVLVVYHDLYSRRIPNGLVLATALLGAVRVTFCEDPVAAIFSLAAAIAVFAFALFLYCRSVLGGGDVKFVSAAALLIGHQEVCHFLIVMSFCGAGLALLILTQAKLRLTMWRIYPPRTSPAKTAVELRAHRQNVPYGVAIAAAGAMIMMLQTLLPR